MKDFSMYDCALKAVGGPVEDLGIVSQVSRRDFDERSTFLFRARVPCLEFISLLIENALLLRTHRGGRVYACFEKLSRMEPVVDLYLRIADVSERVYVLGEPDWVPPKHPNLRVIQLPNDITLAREFFVIANSPRLRAALIGVDEDGFSTPILENRNFRALKSDDPKLVGRLADTAENLIDDMVTAPSTSWDVTELLGPRLQ